jgi:hypothetical protein
VYSNGALSLVLPDNITSVSLMDKRQLIAITH